MGYNDIFRLRIYQRMHGSQVVNVLHFVQDDPTPGIDGAWLANDFITTMTTSLRGRATPQVLFESVEVQSIVPFSGAAVMQNFPASSTGQVGGEAASASLAEVVTIYTVRAGRTGRGRMYLAGLDTFSSFRVAGGVIHATQTGRTVTMCNALAARYIYSPPVVRFHLGVWSRKLAGPTPPWPTDAFARATSLTVRTIVRNQRRRQVGVGR